MIVKERENRDQLEVFSIEEFVPADYLFRKIDSAIDFSHIYDIVKDLHCENNARPSIYPVVIFKMVLIHHIYGLSSLRRTVEELTKSETITARNLLMDLNSPRKRKIRNLQPTLKAECFTRENIKMFCVYSSNRL